MRKYFWLGGGLIVALILFGRVSTLADVPTPDYQVVDRRGDVEIRQYPALIVAEVEVEGSRSGAAGRGFRLLADYIFGGNVPKQKIAMTAPVIQESASRKGEKIAMTAPVIQERARGGDRWRVQFVMPEDYALNTLPTPKNDRVRLRKIPGRRLAALRFSGFWRTSKLERKADELMDQLQRAEIATIGAPSFAFYNDPFTPPFLRRNEVIVELTP